MARYKLTISYDGTAYCGWQVQPAAKPSIQGLIQKALETALRHPINLTGSGRTDAGVHADGQTAHFDSPLLLSPLKLRLALNGLLPPDIRILSIEETLPDFHARYSAVSKIYCYHLHLDRIADPFQRRYRYHVFKKLDLDLMKQAAEKFLGAHDFTSFANEPKRGTAAHDPIRTLTRLDLLPIEGGITLELQADGFLYKMVRNIVGTLIECGAKRLAPSEIPLILAAKDRTKAFSAAPPHGLFLKRVMYAEVNSKFRDDCL